jgi:phosphoserine phosphatase
MRDEINQLIRMTQVLRVRASNLETTLKNRMPPAVLQEKKAAEVADFARKAEAQLKQIYAYFD